MQLVKYKVGKFRSIKNTDWIYTNQWTCFVGENEAGKSNLLLPLWKFNPADNATSIDLLHDYPRDEYSNLDGDESLTKEKFIEALFELSDNDLSLLKNWQDKRSEEISQQTTEGQASEFKKVNFTRYVYAARTYHGVFYISLAEDDEKPLSSDLESQHKEVFNKIQSLIPKFVYYSEYGNLDADLYLPHVKDNLARIDSLSGKERMKARTLNILFSHLKLRPDEILTLGKETSKPNRTPQTEEVEIAKESRNKQERFAKLASASSQLTKQFREWWSQGNYVFQFNADGDYFRIFVSDTERPEPIELESRSRGLQWFFSFFLVFLAESEDNHKNCILLLDEPGLSLHPNAQEDLIRFFHQLSSKNQLLYTTHLPFLVDHDNLDRVKAVYPERGLTKVSNDLNKADKEKKAIQSVYAAIGIKASQSLLVGCDIVIVEGVSDQFYLTMIKNYLVSQGKFLPRKELVFIPVGGVKGIKPVVSILQGDRAELPFVLLDSDGPGKQMQKTLKNGFYSGEKVKVLEVGNFINIVEGAEIEDLIPVDLVVDSFDRLFRAPDGLADFVDEKKAIVTQLEAFAKDNRIELELGWKVDLSRRIKQRFKNEVPTRVENRWIKLFEALQNSNQA